MSLDAAGLYALLPAVYRTRDAAAGGQLQALFAVLAEQSGIVSANIAQLYDDQFIETCEPWVIPYLGDLVGYNSVYELAAVTDSRAEVANTIGYRRRKGTAIALQQVAIDVSGRAAVVVEEFGRLITNQSLRLVRPGQLATVDLRDGQAMRLLGGASANGLLDSPFDLANRTIDVRRIGPRARAAAVPDATPLDVALHGPGRADIAQVAVHLWRWQAFGVAGAAAFAVGGGRYKFSPLGNDLPLFSPLQLPESFTALLTRAGGLLRGGRDRAGRRRRAGRGGPGLLRQPGRPGGRRVVHGPVGADRDRPGAWPDPVRGRRDTAAVARGQLLVRLSGADRRRAL